MKSLIYGVSKPSNHHIFGFSFVLVTIFDWLLKMLNKKQSVGLILLISSILFYLYQYHVFIETKESRKRNQFNEIQKTNHQHEKLMEKQKNHYLNQIKELKETKQKFKTIYRIIR
jgi:Holliday junction resolvase-like predicted endonuclease